MPDLFVTNFNRNFTGVSATAATIIRHQMQAFDLRLVGYPLPGCPEPISLGTAKRLSRTPPVGKAVSIWHVRRNPEMRAAIWARDGLRLPIRIVFTSAAQRRHSALPRWMISRMDGVVATSEAAAGFVPHVRAIAPHGVDTARFTPPKDRGAAWRALGYPGDQGIATIGRIRPEKGTDLFVQAMIDLLPRHPSLTALVIGRASREHQGFLTTLHAQIETAGLAKRILFPGEVPPDALPAHLQGLSLIMQLPRYEGYGMVPLEGMACGVPFVASDAGYYTTFSAQGRAGAVIQQEDAVAAALAADGLLSDTARLKEMRTAARELAHTAFSARAEADRIAQVYADLWAETALG